MSDAARHAVHVDRGGGKGFRDSYVNDAESYELTLAVVLRTETAEGTVVRGLRVIEGYHPVGVEVIAELRRIDGQWTEAVG